MKVEDSKKQLQNPIDNLNEKQLSENPIFFICPYCKNNIPKIIDIKKDYTKNLIYITLNCKCLNSSKIISLNELFEELNKNSSLGYKCYKHKDKEGIEYCENCKYYMCDVCKEYHKDFVKNHKTTSIKLLNKIEYCQTHLNNNLEFYCEKCKINICIDCKKNQHKDHLVISLKEYWEKILEKLKLQNVTELGNKLETERKNYENIIINSLEKITYLMNKFEKLRELIHKYYKLSMGNNKILSSIILSVFSNFFNQKDNPDYINCHNCEKLIPINLIIKEEYNELGIIFSKFSKLFNELTHCESSIIQRDLIQTIEINEYSDKLFDNKNKGVNLSSISNLKNNNNEILNNFNNSIKKGINLKNNPKNNLLNKKIKLHKENLEEVDNVKKKQKKHHIFKIPINEKSINQNHLLNFNNNVINNNTTNNIIFPLDVGNEQIKVSGSAKMEQKKKRDIFTFDAVICQKYVDSQSNDFLETFSNNSVFPDGYECIQLGRVEDNKIIKNKKKKIEEKNNTTEETNNNTNTITNSNINNINNNINNNEKDNNKQNKEDPNFFNNIFYKNNTNSVGDNLSTQNLNISLKNNETPENSINFEKI